MSTASATPVLPSVVRGEPAWDIARLFPLQGNWSVPEYLALNGNYLVEFTDGIIEVLPMPTLNHQRIVKRLHKALDAFVSGAKLGEALFSPLRVRLSQGKFREPDVLFMAGAHAGRMFNEYWDGADLVMEVVSDDDRRRDLEVKRKEYAEAGIPEYWIVDPRGQEITVLKLAGNAYEVHGVFGAGQEAGSVLLAGFGMKVGEVFESATS